MEASSPRPENSPSYAADHSATCASYSSRLLPPAVSATTRNRSGLRAHDVQGLGADGSRRPQDDHVASRHAPMLPIRCQSDASQASHLTPRGEYVACGPFAERPPDLRERQAQTMRRNRILALVTAATTVAALAACAAPDKSDDTTTESGVDAATATSADDFGTMDDLDQGRAGRGRAQRHRAAAGLGQLRRDHRRPSPRSTTSRSTPTSPTAPARTRSTPPPTSPARTRRPTCSTSGSPWRWPTPTCSRRTRSRRSTRSRPSSRTRTAPGSTTTAATWRSATTRPRCPT